MTTATTEDTQPVDGTEGYEEQHCPDREDETHDYAWWDGDECGSCGAAGMTEEERREQGVDLGGEG